MHRIVTVIILQLGVVFAAWAQLTPEQVLNHRQFTEVSLSPDGSRVAYIVRSGPNQEYGPMFAGNPQMLWIAELKTGARAHLLADESVRALHWSNDGKRISFVSNKDGAPQVFEIAATGGTPSKLTSHKSGVVAFSWSPDETQLAFLASDDAEATVVTGGDGADNAGTKGAPRVIHIVSGDDTPTRIWLQAAKSSQERALTRGTFDVAEMAWKAHGEGLFLIGGARPDPDHWTQKIYTLGLTGAPAVFIDTSGGPIANLQASPDGLTISYQASRQGAGELPTDLYVSSAASAMPRDLTASIDRAVERYRWTDSKTLAVQFQVGFVNKLYTLRLDGTSHEEVGFDSHARLSDYRSSRQYAFVRESASELPELWTRAGASFAKPLTHENAEWNAASLAKGELLTYSSSDGLQIEGLLLKPPGMSNGNLPTIILIHGGPVGRWADTFDPVGQLLASHGYAVFYPNIRGASSYGDQLIAAIRSKARGGSGWASGPLQDVIAGLDALIAKGVADPARAGIGGWSYGGYMTALALTRTDRFKTGVAGAGFYDMTTDLGSEIAYYVPGDDWMYGDFFKPETQKLEQEDSPITTVRNLHVPLLLLHGERDPVDTIGQTYEFYRAIQKQNVPTEMVVYPGEGHALSAGPHILDRLTRTLAWYDRYLK